MRGARLNSLTICYDHWLEAESNSMGDQVWLVPESNSFYFHKVQLLKATAVQKLQALLFQWIFHLFRYKLTLPVSMPKSYIIYYGLRFPQFSVVGSQRFGNQLSRPEFRCYFRALIAWINLDVAADSSLIPNSLPSVLTLVEFSRLWSKTRSVEFFSLGGPY